jgi:hypothetical protein
MNDYLKLFYDNAFEWFSGLDKGEQKELLKKHRKEEQLQQAIVESYCDKHNIRIE